MQGNPGPDQSEGFTPLPVNKALRPGKPGLLLSYVQTMSKTNSQITTAAPASWSTPVHISSTSYSKGRGKGSPRAERARPDLRPLKGGEVSPARRALDLVTHDFHSRDGPVVWQTLGQFKPISIGVALWASCTASIVKLKLSSQLGLAKSRQLSWVTSTVRCSTTRPR